jgi:hypothetical protein
MISLAWSEWIPLNADLLTYQQYVSNEPGFYRVRASGSDCLAYIGQTGRSLRQRTRAELAKHVMRPIESPPWNDPHTAAPLLWAFRHEDNMEFELSVAVADLDVQMRQCYEDVLLYLHRLEFGRSTLCNHGRRHPWWSRASNRKDARLAHRLSVPVEYPSLQISSGNCDPLSSYWLGLSWTDFAALPIAAPNVAGVYRLVKKGKLLYVGESRSLRSRLSKHAKDLRFLGCEVSCHCMPDAFPHHLKEREADLIGSCLLHTKQVPLFQYSPLMRVDVQPPLSVDQSN